MPTKEVNELELFYLDDLPQSDTGEVPILMLHGFARNGNIWASWLPVLSAHHRVIRPDIRGCGSSQDAGPDYEFRVPDMVSDYIGLLDALGIERVHHIGESTGGIVGAMSAALHPDRFATVTLVSTPLTTATSDPKVKAPGADSPEESLAKLGLEQWWLQSRAMTNDLFGDDRDVEIARDFARTPLHVALGMWRGMHRPEVTLAPHLAKLQTPTLVLTPTGSWTMSAQQQHEFVDAMPNATQRVYEGASHGMYYLRGPELACDVLEFIDAL